MVGGEAEQAKEGHNLQSVLAYEKCIFEIKKIYIVIYKAYLNNKLSSLFSHVSGS